MIETEKLFTSTDLSDANPPGVCLKCSEHALQHLPTGAVFAHCSHVGAGVMGRQALYNPAAIALRPAGLRSP